MVIGEAISDNQSGFIQDRYIFDGILIANESIQWLKRKRKRGALFKVDFRKAYDSVK